MLQALNVLTPFFTALTPENLSSRFHNGLGVSFSLNSHGQILSSRINVASNPLSSIDQLLKLPSNSVNRAFDVFYHLLLSEGESHGAYLSLKSLPEEYIEKIKTLPESIVENIATDIFDLESLEDLKKYF